MAVENTAATLPGTGASEDRDGKSLWLNPERIQAEALWSRCEVAKSTYSDWLRASNFGFQIPTGSEINGIVVEISRSGDAFLRDSALYLVNSSGTNTGDDKASGSSYPSSQATATYGSSSDLWGATLSPSTVNNSDFGIRLSVRNGDSSVSRAADVYWVKITVYYTPTVTEYKTPLHCVSATRSGSAIDWTNPSRSEESDDYYAEASVPTSSYTDWLRVTEFKFTADYLPESVLNIVGVDVRIERKAGITDNLSDSSLYLRTPLGQFGDDRASATTYTTTDTEVVYHWDWDELMAAGGLTTTGTNYNVRNDDFGIELSVACDADAETIAYVDCISIRLYYLPDEISILDETLRDSCNTGDSARTWVYSTYYRGQTFTPSGSYKITSVKLRLYRYGSPGTLNVNVYATDGSGHPTGSALCSGTTDGDTLPTGSPYEWRYITLGAGYQLTASTKYVIVASLANEGLGWGHRVYWRYTSPSGYAGGNLIHSSDSGSSWDDWATYDAMFEVWGQTGATEGFLLMETDDFLLLEISDKILLEVIGGAAYFRLIVVDLSLSPSISRLAAHPRSVASNLSLSPSITRIRGIVRTITSNLTLAATIGRVVTWTRTIASNLNLSATVSRVVDWARTIASNVTLNPVIIIRRVVDYLITIAANLSLSSTISRQLEIKRTITANLSLSSTISRVVAWARTVSSDLTLSTTIVRSRGIARTVASNLSLAASVAKSATYTRVITSDLTLTPVIVITAVGRLLKVLVAAGNVYIVKSIEGNVYRMKTIAGNILSLNVVLGVVDRVKATAGRVYHMIIKEV